MRRFLAAFLFCAAIFVARAQTVHWEGSAEEPSEVQLVFDDCAPDGDPKLPVMTDSALTLTGTSTQTSIVNGTFSRSTVLTYNVRARRAGATLQIPAFTVETSKGPKPVAAFTGGAARVISESTINARLTPGTTTVWAGEVFPLTYVIDAARRSFSQLASNIDWNPSPLVAEDWSKPEPLEGNVNGEARLLVTYRARAYVKNPGAVEINATNQLVNIATGSVGFGLFQQQRVEQLAVSSKRTSLTVKPLPPAPPGFTGAVGQFKLTSKVIPTVAAVGEPVTWTLELSGSGNWPDIAGLPQREVSKDFQVVQPQARRTPVDGKLFDVSLSEDVVLVPTHPGSYVLNPVSFVYFDPRAGEYKTLTTPRTTVNITSAATAGGLVPKLQVSTSDSTPPSSPLDTAAVNPAPVPPTLPAAIPREALPGASNAIVPVAPSQLIWQAAAPLGALLVFWGWLAVRRARRNDPALQRREARARLAATLRQLASASESDRASLLLAWQHDAALLWEFEHSEPPPTAFEDEQWRQLWREADRSLYRANTPLPTDWIARAEAAVVAKRVPGFSPFSAFRARNLTPFLVLLAFALLVPHLRAVDAVGAYRSGDFAAAEKEWAADVAKNPTNPVARYNLSLAFAQQDRWDLALAHATAALVQDPTDERIRWQFALASEKAGFVPPELAAFPKPGPLQSLAQLASPGGWQRWLVVASTGIALAFALLLLGAYYRPSALRMWGAIVLLALSLLLVGSALTGLHVYGQTADARAVIVWRGSVLRSIPTEADTTQKSSTLAAGSVAVVDDNSFLGWVRLSFENGQTGWVRKDDTVGLWK